MCEIGVGQFFVQKTWFLENNRALSNFYMAFRIT